jgi:hypothetical protein
MRTIADDNVYLSKLCTYVLMYNDPGQYVTSNNFHAGTIILLPLITIHKVYLIATSVEDIIKITKY